MRITLLMILATMIGLSGPALGDDEKKLETEAKKKNACIKVRSRMYFQAVTNEYVYVESMSDKYLMTMQRGCAGLERGYNIRFTEKKRRVCANSRAKLEYEDLQITMPACRIKVIDEVEGWQEAQALIVEKEQAKKKKKEEKEKK